MQIVLMNGADDVGVWSGRGWRDGALAVLRADITRHLMLAGLLVAPDAADTEHLFEETGSDSVTEPVSTILLFRIASPGEIRDPSSAGDIESLIRSARLARLHAALARNPDGKMADADEAPVFLLRASKKAGAGPFRFPEAVGKAARPCDGAPRWFMLGQQDVTPDSQTVEYAEATAEWFSACPLREHPVTTLYVSLATAATADILSLLQRLFVIRSEPPRLNLIMKGVMGLVARFGVSREPLPYYLTPSSPGQFFKQLESLAQQPQAEALVYTPFRFSPRKDNTWRATRYPVPGCQAQLTYLRQVAPLSATKLRRALGTHEDARG